MTELCEAFAHPNEGNDFFDSLNGSVYAPMVYLYQRIACRRGKAGEREGFMQIIIVGCGKVGKTIAERLSAEDHDLIMIDLQGKKLQPSRTLWT